VTDSESEATAAEAGSDDPDNSNAEDGPQNKVNYYQLIDRFYFFMCAVASCHHMQSIFNRD